MLKLTKFNKIIVTRVIVLLTVLFTTFFSVSSMANTSTVEGSGPSGSTIKISITLGTKTMVAVVRDNPTAQEFISLLPMTVTLRDFSPAEKVSRELPQALSQQGAANMDSGSVGDIAYYAPWGNIAFYRGQGPVAHGVIKIARIISGIDALNQEGSLEATISILE